MIIEYEQKYLYNYEYIVKQQASEFSSLNTRITTSRELNFRYRVLLKIVFFWNILKYSGLLPFSVFLGVNVHQAGRTSALSRTGKFQKNHKILRQNTIFNEHPVCFPETKNKQMSTEEWYYSNGRVWTKNRSVSKLSSLNNSQPSK